MINTEYYSGTDLYSEGKTEDLLLSFAQSARSIELREGSEIIEEIDPWTFNYHFDQKRQDLLNWYSFNPQSTLLEIGAGTGALTGLFASKVAGVTALDLSLKRLQINSTRHSDAKNIEYLAGNFLDIDFDRKFDVVTLIGVLEYTRSFIDDIHPYSSLFKKIHALLEHKGTLIIAIENKFGLKYWSGFKEDHTGKLFDGIEGYQQTLAEKGKHIVETFGKHSLQQLLKYHHFEVNDFYYPHPDYKFPVEIFSDYSLPRWDNILGMPALPQHKECHLFNEAAVFQSVGIEQMYPFFANSFLVFCQKKNPLSNNYI